MVKNQKLLENLVTPTTKEDAHDRPISAAEIISEGWMSAEDWSAASSKALELFEFGQAEAAKRGLILVSRVPYKPHLPVVHIGAHAAIV